MSTDNPDKAPMPLALPDAKQGAMALMAASSTGALVTLSSFDPTTPQGGRMLVQATLMQCDQLADAGDRDLLLTHWYAHNAGRTGDDGELDEWTRIVLFTADGKVYSCGSRGIAKSLAIFSVARNSLHFDPPVKCKVKRQQLSGGKQWLQLVPDLDSLCSPAKGKAGRKDHGQ